jgi:hypothetical protein
MKDGDVVGKFHDKDVVVTSGTVEWSEVYGTYGSRAKQSIKIKGKTDMISTCVCINREIKKGETVSAFTVSGCNERIILGKIIRGEPDGLKEYVPPKELADRQRQQVKDIRKFKGTVKSCSIKKRYGVERQWIWTVSGHMFITRKHINMELRPGDDVEFEWFWNENVKDPANKYRTLRSDITIIGKHEND